MRRYLRGFAILLTLIPVLARAQAPPVTAYQAPWNPVGSTASLSVTNATGNVVLGWVASGQAAPATALVCNTGSKTAYVKLGTSAVTAATTDFPVYANSGGPPLCASLALNGASYIAGITGGVDTTSLTISAGTGQAGGPARYGSGGGGMAIDAANATAAALGNIVTLATGCNDVTKVVSGTGTCITISSGLTVGTTTITGGTTNQLLYDNAGVVGEVAGCSNGVYRTNVSFVASCSTILPTALSASSMTLTSPTLITAALGTPTSGVATNLTGTASGLTAGNVSGTGVGSLTSLALGGCAIGTNALCTTGTITASGTITTGGDFASSIGSSGLITPIVAGVSFKNASANIVRIWNQGGGINGIVGVSANFIGWVAGSDLSQAADTVFTRRAAASVQLGQADAAAPVAQILSAQSVVAGTSNTAGATLTIQGSLSTGSGGGDVVIKTTASSAGATAQNTGTTALTLSGGTQNATFAALAVSKGYTVDTLPAGVTGAIAYVTDAVACTFLATPVHSGAVTCPVFYNGTAWVGG